MVRMALARGEGREYSPALRPRTLPYSPSPLPLVGIFFTRPHSPAPRGDLRGPLFTIKNVKNYFKKYNFFVLSQIFNNNKFKVKF